MATAPVLVTREHFSCCFCIPWFWRQGHYYWISVYIVHMLYLFKKKFYYFGESCILNWKLVLQYIHVPKVGLSAQTFQDSVYWSFRIYRKALPSHHDRAVIRMPYLSDKPDFRRIKWIYFWYFSSLVHLFLLHMVCLEVTAISPLILQNSHLQDLL